MLEILEIPVSDIRPAAYNPRKDLKPGDPAYDRLKKALARFDLVEPLVDKVLKNRAHGRILKVVQD